PVWERGRDAKRGAMKTTHFAAVVLAVLIGGRVWGGGPTVGPPVKPNPSPEELPAPKPPPEELPAPKPASPPDKQPQSPPPTLPQLAGPMNPIDLATALRLGGVQNPEILRARERVTEATAMMQLAAAQLLPNFNVGTNYDLHRGPLQQSNG